jgi:hypothetical protein
MEAAALLRSYFDDEVASSELPPYFTLGALPPKVGTAAMDSSDQAVVTFDEVTGVGACRSGINVAGPDQRIVRREVGEIIYVPAHPTAAPDIQLRSRLALEQSIRLITGRRRFYTSLRSGPAMIPPRLVASGVRVVEDYRRLQTFANSVYAVPGMLFMADGRLSAQNFPGPQAIDLQARLLRARGVRLIALTKEGLLISVVRRLARSIRKRVGDRPFAFAITNEHLDQAYRNSGQSSAKAKTIIHGSSSSALGGVGAVRFGLSLIGDHLNIVEMSLYDFEAFGGLVRTGEALESYMARRLGIETGRRRSYMDVYSRHVLSLVQYADWERHIVPTLEEIVHSAYTDTEIGVYPRALADIHNHIKLRSDEPELESQRRRIINELARLGVPVEMIPIVPDGPHKTDPEEFDWTDPVNA